MTLIASITYENIPTILIGDLLATTDSDAPITASIPSGNDSIDINQVLTSAGKRQISSLIQKLNILSDRLCIGVSGDASQAKDFIEVLSFIANEKKLDRNLIERTLSSIEPNRIDRIQFIGLMIELHPTDPDKFLLFNFFSNSLKKKQYRGSITAISAGSGSQDFEELMSAFNWRILHRQRKKFNPFALLNFAGLAISSHFMGSEFLTGSNLGKAWGGGIEIVSCQNGQLRKLDHIGHIFIVVDEVKKSGKRRILVRNKFVKYQYYEDLLLIRVIETVPQKSKNLKSMDTVFVILPATKSINDVNLKDIPIPTFKSKNLLCHIQQKGKFSLPIVKMSDDFLDEFSIKSLPNNQMKIAFSQKYLQEVINILKKKEDIELMNYEEVKLSFSRN